MSGAMDLSTKPPTDRQRSRWLTVFLWLLIALNLGVAVWNWLTTIPPYDPRVTPVWGFVLFGCINLFNAVCLLALLRWQKWGWYGLVVSSLAAVAMNLVIFNGSLGRSLAGLLLPLILLWAMKSGSRPVWDRLDEFAPADLTTPRVLGAGAAVFALPVVGLLGVAPAVVGGCDGGQEDTLLISRGPIYPDGDEIFVSAVDGSSECAITDAHTVTSRPIAWSPSGDKLLFNSEGHTNRGSLLELYAMNPDGTGITQLTNGVPEGATIYSGTWSPDGQQVLYSRRQEDRTIDLYVVNRDGSGRTEIISDMLSRGGIGWSPDGSMIAFTGVIGELNGSDVKAVFIANADGSNVQRLTTNPVVERFEAWLSSGAFVVSGALDGASVDDVHLVSADGSEVAQLTFNVRTRFLEVSPDETTILVSQEDGENRDLYLVEIAGPGKEKITDHEVEIYNGVFSPDGSQIAYSYPTGPNRSVVHIVNVDGTGDVQITSDGQDSAVGPWG